MDVSPGSLNRGRGRVTRTESHQSQRSSLGKCRSKPQSDAASHPPDGSRPEEGLWRDRTSQELKVRPPSQSRRTAAARPAETWGPGDGSTYLKTQVSSAAPLTRASEQKQPGAHHLGWPGDSSAGLSFSHRKERSAAAHREGHLGDTSGRDQTRRPMLQEGPERPSRGTGADSRLPPAGGGWDGW